MAKKNIEKNVNVNVEVGAENTPVIELEERKVVKEMGKTVKEELQEVEETLKAMEEDKEVEKVDKVKEEPETIGKDEQTANEITNNLKAALELNARKLCIRDLIVFRSWGVEEILDRQRTPSHTKKLALEIIASALNGVSCGVITIGHNTETGRYSIINGGSRTTDFIDYYNNELSGKAEMIDEEGKKVSFEVPLYKELTKAQQKLFLEFTLSIDWINGTSAQLARDYKNLNNNTALTGGQKAMVNLSSNAIDIVRQLNTHPVFKLAFSDRQLQKEEQNNVLYLLLANITGCYASSINKVTSNLADKDLSGIDIDRIKYIFDKIEEAQVDLTKFKLIHLAHILYIGDCWKSKSLHIEFNLDDITAQDIAVATTVNYKTSGTNSAVMNEQRINEMAKRLYQQLYAVQHAPKEEPKEEVLDPDEL